MTSHVHHLCLIFVHYTRVLINSETKEYLTVDKVGSEKLLARESCFV